MCRQTVGLALVLGLSACAHARPGVYEPLPREAGGVECKWDRTQEGTRVDCRKEGRPETARAVVVGAPGAQLAGEAHGGARSVQR